MTLEDFLARLPHEPTKHNGETMCRCPAHADKKHSLSVKTGDKGIVLHCFAGCQPQEIVAAMGLKMADLFTGTASGSPAPKRRAPRADTRSVEQRTHTVDKKPLGKLTATYKYEDENGSTLFEVCRYETETDGHRDKTFLQRVYDPKSPSAKRDGYVYKTSGLPHPLYRLPEVLKAIKDGKPVYVVEGEKDVETLRAQGLTATTNAGGASKAGTTIKWTQEHTDSLRGADVIVLPDVDEVGMADRKRVAAALLDVAKSVKLIDLRRGSAALPEKGDISDYVEMLGAEKALAELAKLVVETEPFTPGPDDVLTGDAEMVANAYASVHGYCIDKGRICKMTGDPPYPAPLCTFTCFPRLEITQDDGVSATTVYVIDAWDKNGRTLPQARVQNKAFRGMAWVGEAWGFRANILPGNAVADKLRYVIAEVGAANARRVTEYTHTGWRRIGGEWAYLYQGGAIGPGGVSVELGEGLDEYRLEPSDIPVREAAEWSRNLSVLLAEHISIPMLASVYLAPLREALSQTGNKPLFSVFFVGEQQSGKSVCAELAQYHFRAMAESQFPASFYDTSNHVQSKAFKLKDSLLVVDDYHPTTSAQERRSMDAMAQRLCRMKPRGRMNADGTSRVEMPPRCLSILTGEYEPSITQSGVSRLYVVEVEAKDVPKDEGLTQMQEQGKHGVLRAAMRGYIEWLQPQMDELPDALEKRLWQLRDEAKKLLGDSGPRMSDTVAYLMLGYEMMLKYMQYLGVAECSEDEMAYARRIIAENGSRQTRESREERPSRVFVNTLSDLLLSRVAEVRDLTNPAETHNPIKGMIGYKGPDYYYLNPGLSFAMVCEQVRKAGIEFPISSKALWKQMATDRLLLPAADGSTNTRVKLIDGKSQRLLWVPRQTLDGGEVEEQTRMIVTENGGGADIVEMESDTPF
ncbi:MAG: hypothetical protein PHY64_00855 [Eubacteriales bacterium]|nr:hypothetical protein [Eubacteriales bacterium]